MKNEGKQNGFTFVEVLVSISLLLVLAFIIDVLLIDRILQTRTNNEALAHQIAQQELEALRDHPFSLLTTTTDGLFKGILFNKGEITVASSSIAVSGNNIINMESTSSTVTTTAHLVLPKNAYDDVTISTQFRIFNDSPSAYGGGILFNALDENNGYIIRLSSSNDVFLDIIQDGAVTNLISQLYTVSTDTWYALDLTLSGSSIDLDINSLPIFTTSDTTFEEGYAAIVATDEAHLAIDDITITEAASESWNFDNFDLGKLTGEWQRPGLSNLPSSTAKLNINNYLGSDEIKEVSAIVEWLENDSMKSIEESTLIHD